MHVMQMDMNFCVSVCVNVHVACRVCVCMGETSYRPK